MISHHPSDGIDAYQPPASEHRLERLRLQHPGLNATPSFIVHNGAVREGVNSWPDVQSDILKEESSQRGYTELRVHAETNATAITVTVFPPVQEAMSNDTQITILFVNITKKFQKSTSIQEQILGTEFLLVLLNSPWLAIPWPLMPLSSHHLWQVIQSIQ